MIWALTLKPGQECTHEGLEEVHLSLASLECRPGKCHADGPSLISYLLLRSGRSEHVLCTLEKGHATQQNLDLVLQPREKFTLSVEGSGIVYVTGYSSRPPEDESEAEEEGIIGRIEYEEPLHTIVKQEPEDDFPWEQRDDEGSGHGEGHVESATIHEAPESPQFLEEDGQVSLVNEEDIEQLNQLSEPPSTSQLLEVDGGQHSLIFEQNAVLIKVEPEEMVPENEDTNNVQNQGETSGVSMRGSDTDAGGIASRTRNAIHTVPPAGDTAEGLTEVSGTQQTEDNAENDSTTNGYSDVASNEEGGVFELSSRRKAKLGTRLGRRHPRSTIKRVLPSRRGKSSSLVLRSVNINTTNQNRQKTHVNAISDHECQICGKMFSTKYYRMKHERQNACGAPHGSNNYHTNGGDSQILRKTSVDDLSICQICGKSFSSKYYRMRHEKTHTPKTSIDDEFVCRICGKRFTSKYYRVTHEKLHVPTKTHKCQFCDQTFTMSSERIAHESVHIINRGFNCQFCGKWFRKRLSLGQHENTHTGNKPYKCKFCDKTFGGKTSLVAHENTHTAYRTYDCQVCGKSFTRKYRLKNHLNLHTGNRPYKCKYCDKTYICKDHARAHERSHENRFACHICGKGFFHKKDLLDHRNVHPGLTPYACSICLKGFSGEESMKKHMQVVHMVREKTTSSSL